jgi:hypothetical protein
LLRPKQWSRTSFDVRIPGFVDATATRIAEPFAWRKPSLFVQGVAHVRLAPDPHFVAHGDR